MFDQRAFAYAVRVAELSQKEACALHLPVIFQTRHLMYPVAPFAPAGCDVRFLALPDSVIDHLYPHPGAPQRRFARFETEYEIRQREKSHVAAGRSEEHTSELQSQSNLV